MTRRHSVGLALSGGGARGLAHIGVLKVLEREAIPTDLLAGTSMGGLVATMSAAGMSALDLEREARRMACVRRMVPLIDPTIRQRGILSGQRVAAYLTQHLGDRTFDDLDIPLALTAVDILSQREVVLTRGRLVDAVRATTAIPGLFAPVPHGNRLLVDGGVLNGLPTDVARTMGADVVIAVDVRTPPRPDLFSHIAARPYVPTGPASTLGSLWSSLNAMQAEIGRLHLSQSPPDVIIRPVLREGTSALGSFLQAGEIIAAGERAAEAAMPEIRQRVLAPSPVEDPTGCL